MSIKHILSLTTLAGALLASNAAMADDGHWKRRESSSYRNHDRDLDVIGTARLSARRGTATFRITPEQRRDGLQLKTDAPGLRIMWIEFVYSDGFTKRARGVDLGSQFGDLLTIQEGRPAGLRTVRVRYALDTRRGDRYDDGRSYAYSRTATLELIQLHTGAGYTSDADVRQSARDRDQAERFDRNADYDYRWFRHRDRSDDARYDRDHDGAYDGDHDGYRR